MVKTLLSHESYKISNPNCNYALFGGFCSSVVNFHAVDSSGYEFLSDSIVKVYNTLC